MAALALEVVFAPIAGVVAGHWLEVRWGFAPWGTGVGLAVGLVASARGIRELFRRVKDESDGVDEN